MPARRRLRFPNLPAILLGLAAIALIVAGAVVVGHQLRSHERTRALDEARQLAFGFSRDAAADFWRFREEFIFSLTHLPYERLLLENETAPETLVPVRRFLALNQDLLRELRIVGPDHRGRTAHMQGENYVVFSPITSLALPTLPDGSAPEGAAISGIVQATNGSVRAHVAAVLDPERFWRSTLSEFGVTHPSLWIHLIDADGRLIFSRHAGEDATTPPEFDPVVIARLADDRRDGYEGRVLHHVRLGQREHNLVSAYVPVRLEQWSGMLMVSADEAIVLGPAAQAIGQLATISTALFLTLLGIFLYFFRVNQRYQRALETSRRQAEDSAREAEAANQAKSAFLAMMSHELRTPLNSILGLTETLVERLHGPLNERQAYYLGAVLNSGRHLLNLINDILDLTKIESGQAEIRLERVDLRDVCEQALTLVQPLSARRKQHLSGSWPDDPVHAQADTRQLKQLLVNLLGNAIKFTPEGGECGLRLLVEKDHARLEVWDRGIGIAPDQIGRLFRPFVQLDARLSRDYSGTGLGLALVKQIAQLHGGDVSAQSRLGEGSVFSALIPLAPPLPASESKDTTSGAIAPPDKPTLSTPSPDAPVVLVVDDTPLNVVPVRDYLERRGFRVAVAENGQQAVSETRRLAPALVLMDIQMPEMDGLEATRLIRALPDPALARTPIIAVTALAMSSDRERCLAAGMDDYISKPYSLPDLARRVAETIKSSHERLTALPPTLIC